MLQDPLVGEELWPHTTNPLSQTFQGLKGRLLVDSPIRWDALSCIIPLQSKKQISIFFGFRFDTRALLGAGLSPTFPLHVLPLCLRVILKPQFSAPEPFVFSSVRYERTLPPLLVKFLVTVLERAIFISSFPSKSICSFSVDIRFFCNHSGSKTSVICARFLIFQVYLPISILPDVQVA
jgi:hypothetical protein